MEDCFVREDVPIRCDGREDAGATGFVLFLVAYMEQNMLRYEKIIARAFWGE